MSKRPDDRTVRGESFAFLRHVDLHSKVGADDTEDDVVMQANYEIDDLSKSNANVIPQEVDDCADNVYLASIAPMHRKLECQFMIPANTIKYIISGEYSNHEDSQLVIQQNCRSVQQSKEYRRP